MGGAGGLSDKPHAFRGPFSYPTVDTGAKAEPRVYRDVYYSRDAFISCALKRPNSRASDLSDPRRAAAPSSRRRDEEQVPEGSSSHVDTRVHTDAHARTRTHTRPCRRRCCGDTRQARGGACVETASPPTRSPVAITRSTDASSITHVTAIQRQSVMRGGLIVSGACQRPDSRGTVVCMVQQATPDLRGGGSLP